MNKSLDTIIEEVCTHKEEGEKIKQDLIEYFVSLAPKQKEEQDWEDLPSPEVFYNMGIREYVERIKKA